MSNNRSGVARKLFEKYRYGLVQISLAKINNENKAYLNLKTGTTWLNKITSVTQSMPPYR